MTENVKSYVLPITTYLNQKIVFDLLAVIEDGFAQVTNLNVSTTNGATTKGNAEGEAGFGLYGVKTKIKAAFGMERNSKDEKNSNEVINIREITLNLLDKKDKNFQLK